MATDFLYEDVKLALHAVVPDWNCESSCQRIYISHWLGVASLHSLSHSRAVVHHCLFTLQHPWRRITPPGCPLL